MTLARTSSELTDLCPYRVCINLDRRPERWKRMESRFSEFGLLPVERFSAVDGLKMPIPANWPESPGAYDSRVTFLSYNGRARKGAKAF